jgi:hypothetical protein
LIVVGRIQHVLQAAALGAGITVGASAAYQGYGMARDRRRHPPPGDLVDIGGRRLHLLMTPGAGPPLVIVAALGTPRSSGWPSSGHWRPRCRWSFTTAAAWAGATRRAGGEPPGGWPMNCTPC